MLGAAILAADLKPSGADDNDAIQAAAESGRAVVFTSGTARLTRPVVIDLAKNGYTSLVAYGIARIVMRWWRAGVSFHRHARRHRGETSLQVDRCRRWPDIPVCIFVLMGEEEIDLEETNRPLVDIEKDVQKALHKHNGFLKELGLPLLP